LDLQQGLEDHVHDSGNERNNCVEGELNPALVCEYGVDIQANQGFDLYGGSINEAAGGFQIRVDVNRGVGFRREIDCLEINATYILPGRDFIPMAFNLTSRSASKSTRTVAKGEQPPPQRAMRSELRASMPASRWTGRAWVSAPKATAERVTIFEKDSIF
jgi:hypothetical protein